MPESKFSPRVASGKDATGVEIAHVDVLQHSRDRRKQCPAERALDEQPLSVGATIAVTAHY